MIRAEIFVTDLLPNFILKQVDWMLHNRDQNLRYFWIKES